MKILDDANCNTSACVGGGRNWELTAPWTGVKVNVPTKFIVGDTDMVYHYYPGIQDYIHNGGFKNDVPLLEEVVIMPGVAHWINQEKPQEITATSSQSSK